MHPKDEVNEEEENEGKALKMEIEEQREVCKKWKDDYERKKKLEEEKRRKKNY